MATRPRRVTAADLRRTRAVRMAYAAITPPRSKAVELLLGGGSREYDKPKLLKEGVLTQEKGKRYRILGEDSYAAADHAAAAVPGAALAAAAGAADHVAADPAAAALAAANPGPALALDAAAADPGLANDNVAADPGLALDDDDDFEDAVPGDEPQEQIYDDEEA